MLRSDILVCATSSPSRGREPFEWAREPSAAAPVKRERGNRALQQSLNILAYAAVKK